MKTKRIICAALSALMMFSLIACGENAASVETTVSTTEITTAEETETSMLDSISPQDFGGYEFNYLAIKTGLNDTTRFVDEIWVEAENGEVINDAVFARNSFLLDKLDVSIKVTPAADPAVDYKKSVSSGSNAYAIAGLYKPDALNVAVGGYSRNWNDLSIDYSKPWWSQSAYEKLNFAGHLYLMSGSILISEIDDTLAMVFNKSLAQNYGVTELYDDVQNKKWTIDTFGECLKNVSSDLNGDGELKAGEDLLGYVQDPASMTFNWVFSTGLLNGYLEDDGTYNLNVDTDRVQRMLDKLCPILSSDNVTVGIDLYEGLNYFEANQIFIYAIILRNLELLRSMDLDFGVLPYPMLDESQSGYIDLVGSSSPILAIPLTNSEDDARLSAILDGMAAASLYYVRPAYYEQALKLKIVRDTDSSRMLDIVLASRTYDITCLMGCGLGYTISPLLVKQSTDFTSAWAKDESKLQKTIQKTIDKLTAAG